MNESSSENTNARREADCLCGSIRRGLEEVINMVTPPETACNHFREARIEFLRGIRDIVDHRIDRISRTKSTGGTRVVVE